MGYFLKILRYIQLTLKIKRKCKDENVDPKKLKKIKWGKAKKLRKNNKLRKILKLILKRKIIIWSLVGTVVLSAIYVFAYYALNGITKEQMTTVAAYNLAAENNEVGEYTIFSGEAICDLEGNGGLAIPADILNKYNVKCNGTFALSITYRSYEVYGFTEDIDKKTIIANEETDRGLTVVEDTESAGSTESIESTESTSDDSNEPTDVVVSTEGLDANLHYASNIASFASCLHAEELPLTSNDTDYELVFHTGDEKILERGTYLTGYNWIITRVSIIDIEKQREWKLKQISKNAGLVDGGDINAGDTTLNPQSRWLKNWYHFISDIEAGCEAVNADVCKPYGIMGTFFREAYGYVSADLNSDTWSYEADLTSIDSGVDKATGVVSGGTAWGWGQFTASTWNSNRMTFGSSSAGQELTLDSSLGISRPNCWYASDQVWTTTAYMYNYILNSNTWRELEGEMSGLSSDDKSFILAFLGEAFHNRGSQNVPEEKDSVRDLISIAQNKSAYGISSLYEMSTAAGVVTWDNGSTSFKVAGIATSSISPDKTKYDSKFNLGWHSSSSNYPYQEYGYLNSICGGYLCYQQMMGLIIADSPVTPSTNGGGTNGGATTGGNAVSAMAGQVWSTWLADGCDYYYNYHSMPQSMALYNTATYGKVRPDCSGFVSCVLWQLGYMDHYTPIGSGAYAANAIGWTVVGHGRSVELQAGDILAYNGHVQIFAGFDGSGNRLWYSWGSQGAVDSPAPSTRGDYAWNNVDNFVILRAP